MPASNLPTTIYLRDYAPSDFLISNVELDVDLFEDHVLVRTTLQIHRNPATSARCDTLRLDVEDLTLEAVAVDGAPLPEGDYSIDQRHLTLFSVPSVFRLDTVCRIHPRQNTKLMGLYTSSTGFFTLCEAEGFRRITPFLDRPDVMARYRTTLHADRARYPVLLANGNLVAEGEEETGRHWATWEDPFPKPCYLFAMVVARLDRMADTFVTRSGRNVLLQFFVEPGKLDQCHFALDCLKQAMTWEEEHYDLEVDLDQYNVVAVGDFNAGAMENKGLNVFNTKLVLARPDISTDADFLYIDRTVAHEYFHNWTGNRVTCRDWFQLSLKEGLTVFREQQYAADRYSAAVARIQTVRQLRSFQFAEDAGPMAHPVRPQSYMQISNFYTSTVYSKGAEVVRMMHTLIGPENFRKGIDLYFARHDGQAVTTDDLVQALQDAGGIQLTQFKRWYDQAGTPRLTIHDEYNARTRTYRLMVKQSCLATSEQPNKQPFHLPLTIGLLAPDGSDIPLQLEAEAAPGNSSRVLSLQHEEEVFSFVNVAAKPVPSLGRDFSAPVIIDYDYSEADLLHLLSFDSDPFNRWEAGQRLALNLLLKGITVFQRGGQIQFPDSFAVAFGRVLADAADDPAFAAEVLVLPTEMYIGEHMSVIDPAAIHHVRLAMRRFLGERLQSSLLQTYQAMTVTGPYSPDAASSGRRALRNLCLAYLMDLDEVDARQLCIVQFDLADNMTDVLSALTSLANNDCAERLPTLERFYERWLDEPLVVDKWLGVQAMSRLPGTVAAVRSLIEHPAYSRTNPNKVYALIGSFGGNQFQFHAADGSGYALMTAEIAALDSINPQLAARMARNFERWRRFDVGRQQLMKTELQTIAALPGLSSETGEVITKALNA